jgi:pilin isopeptide linkage protein
MKYNINFPVLEFKTPGVYSYTMRELTPTDRNWETDSRTYRIVVTVTDNGKGSLVASLDYPDGFPKFVNKYNHCPPPPPPPVDPCRYFNSLPFPMFLFVPPQKPEYMELVKSSPHILSWWDSLFNDSLNSSTERETKKHKCSNSGCNCGKHRNSGGF